MLPVFVRRLSATRPGPPGPGTRRCRALAARAEERVGTLGCGAAAAKEGQHAQTTRDFPPLTVPFNHEGDIYEAKVRFNVEKLNLTQVSGYVMGGSTGESVSSTPEKERLWDLVAACRARQAAHCRHRAESVRDAGIVLACGRGYHAAMVRTPSYYRGLLSNTAAQVLYFQAVRILAASRADLQHPAGHRPRYLRGGRVRLSEHPKRSGSGIERQHGEGDAHGGRMPGFQVLGSAPRSILHSAWGRAARSLPLRTRPRTRRLPFGRRFGRGNEAAADWQRRITLAARLVTTVYGIPASSTRWT